MDKKRVIVSTVSQVGSQIIIALLGVVTLKLITNNLGVGSYGVYATVLAFVSTFSLLTDLGLNAINGREIAKHPEDAADIIGQNMGLRISLCVLMVPLIFGLSYIFYPYASHQLRYGILLLTAFLFFDAIRNVALGYFTAQVRGHVTAIVNGLQQILVTSFVIITVAVRLGFYGFILAYIISNTVSMIVTVILVRKELPIRPRVNLHKWQGIMIMSLSLGIIQLVNMMYLKVDSLMLSVIKGTTAVGIYGIAYSLIVAFLTLPSFMMTSLIPSMATSTKYTIGLIVQKAYNYMVIFAALLAVGSYLVRHEIIVAVTGKSFAAAGVPFAILGLASAFSYINNVFGFASVSLNKHHKIIYISVAMLALNIGLNFILIPIYSYNGAAWATLVTEILSLASTYWMFHKQTGIRTKVFLPLLKPAIAAVVTLAIVSLLRKYIISSDNLMMLSVVSIEIIVIFGGMLFLLKGLPDEVREYSARLLRRN